MKEDTSRNGIGFDQAYEQTPDVDIGQILRNTQILGASQNEDGFNQIYERAPDVDIGQILKDAQIGRNAALLGSGVSEYEQVRIYDASQPIGHTQVYEKVPNVNIQEITSALRSHSASDHYKQVPAVNIPQLLSQVTRSTAGCEQDSTYERVHRNETKEQILSTLPGSNCSCELYERVQYSEEIIQMFGVCRRDHKYFELDSTYESVHYSDTMKQLVQMIIWE